MRTRIVNLAFLYRLLIPIAGGAEVESIADRHASLCRGSEDDFRAWIRKEFTEHVARMHPEVLDGCRCVLQYILSSDARSPGSMESLLESEWGNQMPSFDPPMGMRSFFYYLWEVCFSGEDFNIDVDCCEVIDDIELMYPDLPPRKEV